jgi:Uncharacterized conserved protein
MIKKWSVENFKSVNKKVSLELAPLTIFAGANSSGKSTIIQSILLTTQTIQSQVFSRPVVLNGHIVRLGTFDDIISNLAESQKISIGFDLRPSLKQNIPLMNQRRYLGRFFPGDFIESLESISCEFSFSSSGKDSEKEILQLQPKLESCSLRTKGEHDKKQYDELIEIKKVAEEISDRLNSLKISSPTKAKVDLSGLEYEVTSKPTTTRQFRRYYGSPNTGEVVGSGLQHFFPSRFIVVFDVAEEQSRKIIDVLFYPEQAGYYELSPEDIAFISTDFITSVLSMLEQSITTIPTENLPEKRMDYVKNTLETLKTDFSPNIFKRYYQALPMSIKRDFLQRIDDKKSDLRKLLKVGKQSENNLAYIPLPGFSEGATDFVQLFFTSQVKYLGPLRDEPKPVYPLAGSVDPKDIGYKGENTAAVLEVHRNAQINYIPCNFFAKLDMALHAQQSTLVEAVLDWLEYLGVAHGIKTVDKGKLGHELKVSTTGSENLHDLTHVGVGVSQVLPILVQSLLSDSGSTLIFEQPELHLHPRVQTRLADFFVSMTMVGKQCIIETHSEYMINRLRYMSAMTDGDEISKEVILYFVEKEKGHSVYRPIRINKYGVIENWPRGFFDENEENAAETLKAGMHKKSKEKSGGKSL